MSSSDPSAASPAARDTSPAEIAPPLPDEQPPFPAGSPSAGSAPPLPVEEPPLPASKAAPKPSVAEAEDEDDAEAGSAAAVGRIAAGEQEGNDGGEDGEEWDPSKGADLSDRQAVEEKKVEGGGEGQAGDTKGWQAVWAPQANAPLPTEQPPLPQASWGQAYGGPSSYSPYPNAAAGPSTSGGDPSLPPIDPGLAHLLPKSSSSSSAAEGYQSAQFNARTGRFTPANFQYTVDHLAEANRAKRQEGVFFDVGEWEKAKERDWAERKRKEMEDGKEDGGRAGKLSKADMDRFRQKKQEKKARNLAWLKG